MNPEDALLSHSQVFDSSEGQSPTATLFKGQLILILNKVQVTKLKVSSNSEQKKTVLAPLEILTCSKDTALSHYMDKSFQEG